MIPTPGTTTVLIPDVEAGWVYEVTTVVTVNQLRLDNVEQKLAEAQADLVKAQERRDKVQAELDAIAEVLPKGDSTPK